MTDLTPSQLAEANAIGAVSVHAGTEPIAGLGSARGSYHGIAWAANTQKMYAAPYNADNVLIVDYNYHDQCHRHHRSWRVAVLRELCPCMQAQNQLQGLGLLVAVTMALHGLPTHRKCMLLHTMLITC